MTDKLVEIRSISGKYYYAESDKLKNICLKDYPPYIIEVYLNDCMVGGTVLLMSDKIESIRGYTKYVPSVEDMND